MALWRKTYGDGSSFRRAGGRGPRDDDLRVRVETTRARVSSCVYKHIHLYNYYGYSFSIGKRARRGDNVYECTRACIACTIRYNAYIRQGKKKLTGRKKCLKRISARVKSDVPFSLRRERSRHVAAVVVARAERSAVRRPSSSSFRSRRGARHMAPLAPRRSRGNYGACAANVMTTGHGTRGRRTPPSVRPRTRDSRGNVTISRCYARTRTCEYATAVRMHVYTRDANGETDDESVSKCLTDGVLFYCIYIYIYALTGAPCIQCVR